MKTQRMQVSNIVLALILTIVVFICGLSLLTPLKYSQKYLLNDIDSLKSLSYKDIISYANCTVRDNNITVSGNDASIIFKSPITEIEAIILEVSNVKSEYTNMQMFYSDENGSFSEENSLSFISNTTRPVVFDIPKSHSKFIRVDIDTDYTLKNISFSDKDLEKTLIRNSVSTIGLLTVGLISIAIGIIMVYVSQRFLIADKLLAFLCKNSSNAVKYLCYVGISLIPSILLFLIFAPPRNQVLTIAVIFVMITHIIYFRKKLYERMHTFVFGAIILMGILLINITPFAHTVWDLDNHYNWALKASYIGDVYYSESDNKIILLNEDFNYPNDSANTIKQYNETGDISINSFPSDDIKLSSLPSGLFLALGRLFGLSFYERYCLGRVANLFLYALICCFAIKHIKSGRVILSIIILFPTNLFIASNYSYDWWVTSFTMLGISYFVNECQNPEKPITIFDSIVMCGSIAIGCIPKLVYMPLLLLPFFVKKNDYKSQKKHYIVCFSTIILLALAFLIISLLQIKSGGDLRGGDNINPKLQVLYIMHNPIIYAKTLLKFLSEYLSINSMHNCITFFAHLGSGKFSSVIIILFIIAIITDKSEIDRNASGKIIKSVSVLQYFGVSAMIATALYISFTPVGSNTVNGCQVRYITPLLYPLVALLSNGVAELRMNKNAYAALLLVPCIAVAFQNAISLCNIF